jgi:membrane fusion protein (multidrug efflux system)
MPHHHSGPNRRDTLLPLLTSIAFLAAWVAGGCAREVGSSDVPESARDSLRHVRTSYAAPAPPTQRPRAYRAHLYSERDADVYSRLRADEYAGAGIPVTAVLVEIGDRVEEGSILATLESSDARLLVDVAEPEAEIAWANLERVQELAATGAVSQVELEDALLRSRTADAVLEKARLNLSRTTVRAPFAGVVSRRHVRVGEMVDDEVPLFRITALAPLRARLLVPESEMSGFATGAPVRLSSLDGSAGTARVILVGPTTDPGSATREVIVELSDVGAFRPGGSVMAELTHPTSPESADGSVPGPTTDSETIADS